MREAQGQDNRSLPLLSFTWTARPSRIHDEGGKTRSLLLTLLSPCCEDGFGKQISPATAKLLPRLRPPVAYEALICLTCDGLFGHDRRLLDVKAELPRPRFHPEPSEVVSSWAEACGGLNTLQAQLWASELLSSLKTNFRDTLISIPRADRLS